jgi:hypothetical protein
MALGPDVEAMAGSICGFVVVVRDMGLLLAAHHGGKNGMGLMVLVLLIADMRHRSFEVIPRSSSTAVLCRQPSKMVMWRPLGLPSPVMVFSDRRLQVYINLQTKMPRWRPYYSTSAMGFPYLAPSDSVPTAWCLVALRCSMRQRRRYTR